MSSGGPTATLGTDVEPGLWNSLPAGLRQTDVSRLPVEQPAGLKETDIGV